MVIFHSYVKLPEGISVVSPTFCPPNNHEIMEKIRCIHRAPQVGRYSWQHQLQGVLEFEKVDFANRSIVAFGSVTDHE